MPTVLHHAVPVDGFGMGAVGQHDDVAEGRSARVPPRPQAGHGLAQHGQVVHWPRALAEDHGHRVRLTEDVRHVLGADEDGADLHDREHGVDPLGTVDHPEGDLVAGGDTELDQPLCDGVDAGAHLGEGPALLLEDEGLERRALGREPDRVSVAPVSHDVLLAKARGRS